MRQVRYIEIEYILFLFCHCLVVSLRGWLGEEVYLEIGDGRFAQSLSDVVVQVQEPRLELFRAAEMVFDRMATKPLAVVSTTQLAGQDGGYGVEKQKILPLLTRRGLFRERLDNAVQEHPRRSSPKWRLAPRKKKLRIRSILAERIWRRGGRRRNWRRWKNRIDEYRWMMRTRTIMRRRRPVSVAPGWIIMIVPPREGTRRHFFLGEMGGDIDYLFQKINILQ